MSESAESVEKSISQVRIGVATHVAPQALLTGNDALQDLLLVIDECIDGSDLKIIIDFSQLSFSKRLDRP